MPAHKDNLALLLETLAKAARKSDSTFRPKYECYSCGEYHHMTPNNIIKFYEGGYSEEYFCDDCIIAGKHIRLGGY
jgi:hypothetical protein